VNLVNDDHVSVRSGRSRTLPFLFFTALAAPFTASCSSSNGNEAASNAQVLDPTQPHDGHTDAEWGALWWKWIYELPQTANDAGRPNCIIPFQDPTGENCAVGQSGDVFFLAGASGGTVVRDKCVVPSGKAIFFPIVSFAFDNGGVPATMQSSDSALMGVVQTQMAGVSVAGLSAEFDGLPIANLGSFATPATKFSYTLPPEPNNYTCEGATGVTGVIDPSYAAGYFVMLPPPAPGAHVLHFKATSSPTHAPAMVNGLWDLGGVEDVTYHFTVQ
jgi:hypothetical protein